jgi:dTDP-glucose pyrophosphorylase
MQGVLTLAGEGTRMLPWTRGLRKEFLPLFDRSGNGTPVLKPVAHLVLEALVAAGIDDVTLVVGAKDLEFVRQYFTIDPGFLRRHADKSDRLHDTRKFYDTLRGLQLHFAVQPAPRGFGDAVLQAAPFVGPEGFLLHAADAVLVEPERGTVIQRLARLRAREELDAVLLVRNVADPTRYGVVEGTPGGRFEGSPRLRVTGMEEKPERPRSHWAATAVYAFSPRVFDGLRAVRRQRHPAELEVTDAIRWLLGSGSRVAALVLRPSDGEWRSVGSPDGYLRALKRTQAIARRPSTP